MSDQRGLGFEPRRRMTRWLDLREMVPTALAIRRTGPDGPAREAMAPGPAPTLDLGSRTEVWFDYVADLGDAFDPTMAVAWHLGRGAVTVPDGGGDQIELPRGDLLVMGGDEVYPFASAANYRNQTVGPYAAAFEGSGRADLLALPGNHDWYGGIGAFLATFASGARVGGWQTHQGATWFSAQLPHGWHLWGVDTALSGTIGETQRAYFASQAEAFTGQERIVLCTPVPLWVLLDRHQADYEAIAEFRRTVIGDRARIPLHLAGDTHFLAAADEGEGSTRSLHVTSGGGGAFLHPTHHFASRPIDGGPLLLPRFTWPDREVSRAMARPWWRSLLDRQILGVVATVAAVLVVAAVATAFHPAAVVPFAAVALAAGVLLVKPNTPRAERRVRRARLTGVALGTGLAVVVVATAVVADQAGSIAWSVASALVGALVATAVLVATTARANRTLDAGDNLVFSARHLASYKHFLRCHIRPDGTLRVHALGIEEPGDGWAEAVGADGASVPPGCSGLELLATWDVA